MSKFLAIIFTLIASIFGSVGMLFFKKGSVGLSFKNIRSLIFSIINRPLIAAVVLFFITFFIYIYALKEEQLVFVLPFISLSYVWTTLLAHFFLEERITKKRTAGILLIVLGVIFVSVS